MATEYEAGGELLSNIVEKIGQNTPLFLYDSLNVVARPDVYFEKYKGFIQVGNPILNIDSLIDLLKEKLKVPKSTPKIVYDSRRMIQSLPLGGKMFPEPLTDDQINLVYFTEAKITKTNLSWVEFRIDTPFAGLKRIVTTLR